MDALTLDKAFNPKRNSLDFLRVVLAGFVIFSHAYPLGGFGAVDPFGLFSHCVTLGGFAVGGFFAVSGFLVTRSFVKSPSTLRFLWHRVLRIMPGYWACLVVTAGVFAPLAYLSQHHTLSGFWKGHHLAAIGYVKYDAYLVQRQLDVGGLPNGIPYPGGFNGSLHTLLEEFRCYLLVALLGAGGVLTRSRGIVLGLFSFLVAVHLFEAASPGSAASICPLLAAPGLLGYLLYFFAGSLFFLYQERIVIHDKLAAFSLAVLYLSFRYSFSYPLIPCVTVPYLLLWAAVRLPVYHCARYGDLSYGLYLYGFPVQQVLSGFGVHHRGLFIYLMATVSITLLCSVLSYHLVEGPCLKLKHLQPFFWRKSLGLSSLRMPRALSPAEGTFGKVA